jgi:low affinity Fe/Cu permease
MDYLDVFINRFASSLATTIGFLAIMVSLVVGFAFGVAFNFGENWSILFTMYLSLAAIVITATILIAQKRDTAAIQAKLDELILSGASNNRLIGIDRQTSEEIEMIRQEQHGGAAERIVRAEASQKSPP